MPPKAKKPPGNGGKAGMVYPKKNPKDAKKKKPVMKYRIYIRKVLKQIRDHVKISAKSMLIMNNFVVHHFQNIAKEASNLARYANKKTITVKELKAAVELLFPAEIIKYANRDGDKAVRLFEEAGRKSQGRKRGRGQQT